MNETQQKFIAGIFHQAFSWMSCGDIQRLYEKMKDAIHADIIECADKEFNSDDVLSAIRRVLFNNI